jgi:hypothetical protein
MGSVNPRDQRFILDNEHRLSGERQFTWAPFDPSRLTP